MDEAYNSSINKTGKHDRFTMVYLDLDDTLIPTTIRNSIRINFGFELFNIINTKSLQSDIINTIKKIENMMMMKRENIQFVIVSNASQQWIHDMLLSKTPKFPLLGEYLKDNKISMLSAPNTTYKYLCDKFGELEANKLISSEFNNNRFMYKYTTFCALIKKYEHILNLKCNRVISIGDGQCEQKALQIFSNRNKNINSINIIFRKAPTIDQLQSQWKYIKTYFNRFIHHNKNNNNNNYIEIDLNERVKNDDNNILCTGKYQLSAIALYFNGFMKILQKSTQETKQNAIQTICQIVYSNLTKNDKSSPRVIQLKEMLRIAYMNQEFNKSISEMMNNHKTVLIETK